MRCRPDRLTAEDNKNSAALPTEIFQSFRQLSGGGIFVAQIRTMIFRFVLLAGVADFSLPGHAHAASCDAILGKWAWFTKGVVTFNPDGTFAHEPGNDGTWECTDAARGKFTLRWRLGGYVNQPSPVARMGRVSPAPIHRNILLPRKELVQVEQRSLRRTHLRPRLRRLSS